MPGEGPIVEAFSMIVKSSQRFVWSSSGQASPKVAEPHTRPPLAPVASPEVVVVTVHLPALALPPPTLTPPWFAPPPPSHGALGSALLARHALQTQGRHNHKHDGEQLDNLKQIRFRLPKMYKRSPSLCCLRSMMIAGWLSDVYSLPPLPNWCFLLFILALISGDTMSRVTSQHDMCHALATNGPCGMVSEAKYICL